MNDIIYNYKRFPVTMGLITICIVMYVYAVIMFQTTSFDVNQALMLGCYNPLYVAGLHQYYRIISANLFHFTLPHLLMNCYSLYGLGRFVENQLDTTNTLFIYFVSAVCTSGLQYLIFLVNPTFGIHSISGGISGVVFGIFGCIAVLTYYYKDSFYGVFSSLAPQVGILLLVSLLFTNISFWGHVCGMLGGMLATVIVVYFIRKKRFYS